MKRLALAAFASALTLTAGTALAQEKEIAVIVKTANATFWQNVQKGADAAMQDVEGYSMTFQGPASESAIADQVNICLLYTSPSPRDKRQSRMPSSA